MKLHGNSHADVYTNAVLESRVALVIGNGAYEKRPLKNPVNDAEDIARILKKLKFDVQLIKDANRLKMREAIDDFGKKLSRSAAGLFYYAGHGVQVEGVNYLIPVGANIQKELHILDEAIDISYVLRTMDETRVNVKIVILDACRDNPFEKFRSLSGRGLAQIASKAEGTLIAYSTGPGMVAEDGTSRNSPYTEELLKYIPQEGLEIWDVMKQVRSSVMEKTNKKQMPWETTSLMGGGFYFNPVKDSNTGILESLGKSPKIILRDTPESVSDYQARKILEKRGFFDANWNASAIGLKHFYVLLKDGNVVHDKSTNLTWHQSGSDIPMTFHDAEKYIMNLNIEKRDGFTDWRLPTLEEAMSLMEKNKNHNGLFLNSIFDETQRWIWTSDYDSTEMAWFVHFSDGICSRALIKNSKYFVRAVRSE